MATSSNPAFSRNAAFSDRSKMSTVGTPTPEKLQEMYAQPSANSVDTDRMTIEDSVIKTAVSFGVLIVGAVLGWALAPSMPAIVWVAAGIGFVLALVNIFKREPSPALVLAYAFVEGVFIGGISMAYENVWSGIVAQAVIATIVVFGVTLALFASGKIRASKKATKVFLIAMVAYLVFSILNVILMATGANSDPWGLRSADFFGTGIPVGVVIGILVVIMGAYSLVLDFDMIQQGVKNRAPRKFGWSGAFGIMLTVVWLYLEILRILGIARTN